MKIKSTTKGLFELIPETQAEEALSSVFDQRTWISWEGNNGNIFFEDEHYKEEL